MEKISIVIPCYNVAHYINRAVESALNQTFSNIEIVLVNDGSTDNTLDVLNAYARKDSRIKVINKANNGVTSARLAGVIASTGNWIGFIDGDDYIDSDMYEKLLHNAIKYDSDISHCGYQMVFPSRIDYYYNSGSLRQFTCQDGVKALLAGECIEPGVWNKLYKKELFDELIKNNSIDLSIRNLEDLLMNYYLFSNANNSVFEDFCPYHYIIREGSASTSSINEHQICDPIKVFNNIKSSVADSKELTNIINSRMLRKYIYNAILKIDKKSSLIKYRTDARLYIRHNLKSIFRGEYSIRLKLQSVMVTVWPYGYKLIHSCYSKLSGTDKKYEIK